MIRNEDEMYRQGRRPEQVEGTAKILTDLGKLFIWGCIIYAAGWIGFTCYKIFFG